MMPRPSERASRTALKTIGDWVEFALHQFEAANLSYGHGTANALDEAAFLVLRTLGLPIDSLERSIHRKITPEEGRALGSIVEERIRTRKPAAYLLNEAWIGDYRFYVDERVIVPRSYIGELLRGPLDPLLEEVKPINRILDLCTGSGCLAILAAEIFPDAKVDAADLSKEALTVARRNVEDYGLTDRIRLVRSDLLSGLGGERYDLILTNPPYVAKDEVATFPPEYAAEPVMAHLGGEDGMELVRKIIDQAGPHLTPRGLLVAEVGTGRASLEADFPALPFLWLDTEESSGEVFAIFATELAQHPKKVGALKSVGKV
jgi:ribosomal protein L3 glutamine methyltransferase